MSTKILVVEDELPQREMLSDALLSQNFSVVTAENGKEALKIFNKADFDLLITDLQMPKMDGIVLSKKIKATHPNLPIIVLTGHVDPDTMIDLLDLGVDNLLKKPYDIDHLLGKVGKALDRQRYISAINQMSKMAILGTLTPSVAHELRNALAELSMAVMSINKTSNICNKMHNKYVKVLSQGVERANRTVNHLLNFSRTAIKVEKVAITPLLDSLLTLVEDKLKLNSIVVKKEYRQLKVNAVPDSLKVIFLNLIMNAMQAIESDGEISLKIRGKNGHVNISIGDNGSGIEKDNLGKIFEMFYSSKGDKGTGLGLPLVKQEIERIKGGIAVESNLGKGTTFTVSIPKA